MLVCVTLPCLLYLIQIQSHRSHSLTVTSTKEEFLHQRLQETPGRTDVKTSYANTSYTNTSYTNSYPSHSNTSNTSDTKVDLRQVTNPLEKTKSSSIDPTTRTKQHNIVFGKVHKAASSTMHNILTRFALTNNLNLLINSKFPHINEFGYRIDEKTLVPKPCGSSFHILCNHLIFNRREISRYFPSNTVYLGIVREPFRQFLSAFVYYSYVWPQDVNKEVIRKDPNNPIEEFLTQSSYYLRRSPPNTIMINNRMSVDFGFPIQNFEQSKTNASKISEFVNSLNQMFDFVLIVEYFDESLVMLRRLLNWTTKDIIYIKNNVQQARHDWLPFVNRTDYPDHVKSKFEQFASLDLAVYRHFRQIFLQRLTSQPPDFYSEVKAFRQVRNTVTEYCSSLFADRKRNNVLDIPGSEFTGSFNLSTQDCVLLADEEITLTNKATQAQFRRAESMHQCPPN